MWVLKMCPMWGATFKYYFYIYNFIVLQRLCLSSDYMNFLNIQNILVFNNMYMKVGAINLVQQNNIASDLVRQNSINS